MQRKLFLLCLSTLLLGLLSFIGIYTIARRIAWIRTGNDLAKMDVKYEQSGTGKKILILGDSLAYGVGSSSPVESFAGELGKSFPNAQIINKAHIGYTTKDLAESVDRLIDRRYDIVFVIIGSNDIVKIHNNMGTSGKYLEKIYDTIQNKAKRGIVITSPDFRNVRFIPSYALGVFSERSSALRKKATELQSTYSSVTYIDFFNVDYNEYDNFDAEDKFHLNDTGIDRLVSDTLLQAGLQQ